jgi:preprotein translocase subunit SecD
VRRYVLILATLVAAIAGIVVLAVVREPTLGLDLQGGLEVVLEARPERGQELTEEDLDRSVEFFTQLGFTFDPRFTDETATAMIVTT